MVMASARLTTKGIMIVRTQYKSMGLTQGMLGEQAFVSPATVKRFVAGRPISRPNFQALCEVLGLADWQTLIDERLDLDSTGPVRPSRLENEEQDSEPTAALAVTGIFSLTKQAQIKAALEMLKKLLLEGDVIIHFPDDDPDDESP
jgi:hypothetical protein